MTSPVIIQLNHTNLKELSQIVKIHNEIPALWVENYIVNEKEIEEDTEKLLIKLKEETAFCFMIKDENNNDSIISFIWVEIDTYSKDTLEIISLWTDKNYRKQGFAYLLKGNLENWAKKNGRFNKVRTTVNIKNQRMIELNKKLNYNVTSYTMTKILK